MADNGSCDDGFVPQAAAIPYRISPAGNIEVLLITNRAGEWGIPKGLIDPGFDARLTAANESMEEAGVAGRLSLKPVGIYDYPKYGGVCRVQVYALRVTREVSEYDECRFRKRHWFAATAALEQIANPDVRDLVERFAAEQSKPAAGRRKTR